MASTVSKPKESLGINFGDIKEIFRKLSKRIQPHIGFAYTTILLLGIVCAVYFVSQALESTSSGTGQTGDSTYSTTFDNVTINKISNLSMDPKDQTNITLPGGRINPFAE